MAHAYRIDRAPLNRSRVTRTDQGYLRVPAHLTTVGVFPYSDPATGKQRLELRLPEDVFHADSLRSYQSAPVTDDHPPSMLNAENTRSHEVGHVVGDARRDGELVAADLMIRDAATIAKVEAGKREISNGYRVRLEETPGVHPQYGRYDAIQRDIRVNHVAIVDIGRAGPEACIRMDAWPGTCIPANLVHTSGVPMPNLENQKPEDLLAAAVKQLAAETARADAAEQKLKDESARADAATGRADELASQVKNLRDERIDGSKLVELEAEAKKHAERADVAEKKLLDFDERVATAAKNRVDIERKAARILPEAKFDGMSDFDVMVEVLGKRGVTIEAGATPEYTRARFDAAIEAHEMCDEALARVGAAAAVATAEAQAAARADVAPRTAKAARDAMIKRNREACTTPSNTVR